MILVIRIFISNKFFCKIMKIMKIIKFNKKSWWKKISWFLNLFIYFSEKLRIILLRLPFIYLDFMNWTCKLFGLSYWRCSYSYFFNIFCYSFIRSIYINLNRIWIFICLLYILMLKWFNWNNSINCIQIRWWRLKWCILLKTC